MKFNLLENSLDYILDAVSRLKEPEPDKKSVKYALLHLWSGIELLLKKKLMDEHCSLIFKNIDDKNVSKKSLETGDFVSVYYNELVKRLKKFCDIDIEKDLEILDKVRKDRNRIEHYQVETSKIQVVSNLIKVWGFIYNFISTHIDLTSDETSSELFEQIKEIMLYHEDFIKNRSSEVESELKTKLKESKYSKPLKCPYCFQKAVPLLLNDENEVKCIFCNTIKNYKDFIKEWKSTWNYSGPYDCLNCGGLECICLAENAWVCFECCEQWDLKEFGVCASCETRLVSNPDKEPYCESCLTSIYD